MYRQSMKAEMESQDSQCFFNSLASLPIVDSGLAQWTRLYGETKMMNKTVNLACNSAEWSLRTVARFISLPTTVLQKINQVGCVQLAKIKEAYPIVEAPADEVIQCSKKSLLEKFDVPLKTALYLRNQINSGYETAARLRKVSQQTVADGSERLGKSLHDAQHLVDDQVASLRSAACTVASLGMTMTLRLSSGSFIALRNANCAGRERLVATWNDMGLMSSRLSGNVHLLRLAFAENLLLANQRITSAMSGAGEIAVVQSRPVARVLAAQVLFLSQLSKVVASRSLKLVKVDEINLLLAKRLHVTTRHIAATFRAAQVFAGTTSSSIVQFINSRSHLLSQLSIQNSMQLVRDAPSVVVERLVVLTSSLSKLADSILHQMAPDFNLEMMELDIGNQLADNFSCNGTSQRPVPHLPVHDDSSTDNESFEDEEDDTDEDSTDEEDDTKENN